MAGLHAVLLLVDGQAPGDGCRLGLRIGARDGVDVVHVEPADLGGPFGRHLCGARGQLVESPRPLLHEVLVVELFLHDDVDEREAQRRVGAGAQAQLEDGAGGEPVHARVDGDELCPAAHEVEHGMAEQPVAVGGERLLAPDHDDFRNHVFGVVVSACQAAGIVDFRVPHAGREHRACAPRLIAGVARLGVGGVRRAEHGVREGLGQDPAVAAGAAQQADGLRSVLFLDLGGVPLDDVEGVVPRGLNPFVLAAVLAGALHRMDHARRVVEVVLQRQAADAQPAVRDRVVLVSLHLFQNAVFVDVELDAAADRMAAGRRPDRRARDCIAVFLVAPGFSKVVLEFHSNPHCSGPVRRPCGTGIGVPVRTPWPQSSKREGAREIRAFS